jgi:hypothetical protein
MKTKDEVRIIGRPEFYTVLYFDMKKAALELGYTLSMHGSMHSDMDLIAVAWVQDAKPVEELVKAINDCLGKTVWSEHNLTTGEEKPHGRLCYSLSIGSDWHIDLSVIAPSDKDLIIHGLEEGSENWKAEYDNCRALLQELVDLKIMKENLYKGNPDSKEYAERKPKAWEAAKEFLSTYQHEGWEDNPYLLSGDELERAENLRKLGR